MMVVFQRKIIYLPSVPPGGRNETLVERSGQLGGMSCEEVEVKSSTPTRWLRREVTLKGIQLHWAGGGKDQGTSTSKEQGRYPVVIVYLQGALPSPAC